MLGEYIGKETKEGGYDFGQILGDKFIFDTLRPIRMNCIDALTYPYEIEMLYGFTESFLSLLTAELNHK